MRKLLSSFLSKRIGALAGDLEGQMKPLARLVLMQVFKVSNSTGPRLQIGPNGGYLLSSNLMAYSFIPVFSGSSVAFSTKKMLLQLEYFAKTLVEALSNSKALTWACFLDCTSIFSRSQMATCTTNVSLSTSNITIINSFGLIIWTCSVMDKTLLVVQVLYVSVFLSNDTSALLIFKKNILGSSQIQYQPLGRFPERILACWSYLLPKSLQLPFQKSLGRSYQFSRSRYWSFGF